MNQTPKAIGKIIVALILGVFVLSVSSSISLVISKQSPDLIQSLPVGQGFIIQMSILILSILLILVLCRGDISRYGLMTGKNIQFPRIILIGLTVGIIGTFVASVVPEGGSVEPEYGSFINLVIGVWILASISEEVFTRGLIQGYLDPLGGTGFSLGRMRISLPVFISGLFFSLMHFAVLSTGASVFPVVIIVLFAFALGIIAGYYREKSGSLIPAIMVHMCANIGGWLADLIVNL